MLAKANGVPVAHVCVSCGSKRDNPRAYTYMCTVPLPIAADIDPTTKAYSVNASAFESATEDTKAD